MMFPFLKFGMRANGVQSDAVYSREPNLRGHVPALDALRGLAILVVTLYRFGGGASDFASTGNYVLPFVGMGSRGVDLFFVLSGFLITGILYDTKAEPRYFLNFYARRTVRIFPLYYGVLIAALLFWPVRIAAHDYAPWLWLYAANILQSWNGWCLGWLNHLWSLAVEEHFYLVWPAVIYGLSRTAAMRACGVLFVLSSVSRILWANAYHDSAAPEVCTLFRLDGLVAGSFLALAARSEGGLMAWVRPAQIVLGVVSCLLIPCLLRNSRLLTIPETLWALECAAFLVLVVTAAPVTLLGRFGESKFLHWLGKYSYGMYMHQNLLIPLLSVAITAGGLVHTCGSLMLGQLAYMLLMSFITAGVAYLSWHGFEKHFLKLKRYFDYARS